MKEASDRFWLVKKSAERDCQAVGLAYLSGTYVREAAEIIKRGRSLEYFVKKFEMKITFMHTYVFGHKR